MPSAVDKRSRSKQREARASYRVYGEVFALVLAGADILSGDGLKLPCLPGLGFFLNIVDVIAHYLIGLCIIDH